VVSFISPKNSSVIDCSSSLAYCKGLFILQIIWRIPLPRRVSRRSFRVPAAFTFHHRVLPAKRGDKSARRDLKIGCHCCRHCNVRISVCLPRHNTSCHLRLFLWDILSSVWPCLLIRHVLYDHRFIILFLGCDSDVIQQLSDFLPPAIASTGLTNMSCYNHTLAAY